MPCANRNDLHFRFTITETIALHITQLVSGYCKRNDQSNTRGIVIDSLVIADNNGVPLFSNVIFEAAMIYARTKQIETINLTSPKSDK